MEGREMQKDNKFLHWVRNCKYFWGTCPSEQTSPRMLI